MAPKKTVKRVKRTLPPRKKNDGFDPRLVALGAGAGAVAGRVGAGYQAKRKVAAGSSRAYARDTEKFVMDSNGGRFKKMDQNERVMASSEKVYDDEYRKMPRAKNDALARFKTTQAANRNNPAYRTDDNRLDYDRADSDARRTSGLSKKGEAAYEDKKFRKAEGIRMRTNNQAGGLYDDAVSMRTKRKAPKYARRGAAVGAALATLAQLVAAELRKKK